MENINPNNYVTQPTAGFLDCTGCAFYVEKYIFSISCDLSNNNRKKFNHLHGCCVNNDHIYILKEADTLQKSASCL